MDSKELSIEANERELLQIEITSNQERNEEGRIENKIGEELKDKKVGEDWKVLVTEDGVYGTNWYYIAKGTNISNHGKLENSWIINYETGEVKNVRDIRRLKDIENLDEVEEIGDNIILSSSDSLAVEEGLILNIDSSVIDGDVANEQEALQEKLGEGVELVNFDYNNESGLTPTSFNFDGVNDYIKVPCDDSLMYHADGTAYMGTDEETGEEKQLTKKEVFARNGFTFEFYGIISGGTSYKTNNEKIEDFRYKGLFCFWNGIETNQAQMRFGISDFGRSIYWNAGYLMVNSDLSRLGLEHCQEYFFNNYVENGNIFEDSNAHFLAIVLDTRDKFMRENDENEYYKHFIYIDGEKVFDGGYNKAGWDQFITKDLGSLTTFCVGRSSLDGNGWWHYSDMNCYTLRLYNRGLNDEEVIENYKSSKVYHNFIEKLNNK